MSPPESNGTSAMAAAFGTEIPQAAGAWDYVTSIGNLAWDIICGMNNIRYQNPIAVLRDMGGTPPDREPGTDPEPPTSPPQTGGGGGGGGGGLPEIHPPGGFLDLLARFGGAIGGMFGGGGGSYYGDTSTDPCACDPATFISKGYEGAISVNAGPVLRSLRDTIAGQLTGSPFTVGEAIELKGKVAGSLETCCENNRIGIKGSVSKEVSVELPIQWSPWGIWEKSLSVPIGPGTMAAVKVKLFGGIELTLSGSMSEKYETACHFTDVKQCFTGSLKAVVGPKLQAIGEATALINGVEVKRGLNISFNVQVTGISVSLSLCQPGGGSLSGQIEGAEVSFSIEADFGAPYTLSSTFKEVLWEPIPFSKIWNYIFGSSADSAMASDLDAAGIASLYGYGSPAEMVSAATGGAVPVGAYADTMTAEELSAALVSAEQIRAAAQNGRIQYVSVARAAEVPQAADAGSVCAQMRLQLEQQAALTRKVFGATLDITNRSSTFPLEDILVSLNVYDAAGNLANDKFTILAPELTGMTVADDGQPPAGYDPVESGPYLGRTTYRLGAGASGRLRWTLIPTAEAAPDGPTAYTIGGVFAYTQNGVSTSNILVPGPITVVPDAELQVQYFWQRDVYGDDPFTPEVEPAVPYSLGILVSNVGEGAAYDFTMMSGQPQVIENVKGRANKFEILATEVAGQLQPPSMAASFGDIAPGQTVVGRWLMTSLLQGHFSEYTASFTHIDPLGGLLPSVLQGVEIHELIHVVEAAGAWDDGQLDFLTNDVKDDTYQPWPDTLYLSDGTVCPVYLGSVESVSLFAQGHGLEAVVAAAMPSPVCVKFLPMP
jgi:hypothetical protein